MLVVLCPGQGSQTPAFLSPWLELPAFAESLEAMSSASGIDLAAHGTTSDADTIRDTKVAQPLIVGAGVATLAALKSAGFGGFTGVAGHSVGEVTASVAAGIFTPETGIRFVAKRGSEMAAAASKSATSMAAVLGGDQQEVADYLISLGLTPANYNGAGQIVAAGSVDDIAKLLASPLDGTKVIPLQVAGAFHTSYMEPAVAALSEFASSLDVADPEVKIWTNSNGTLISSGTEYLASLVAQVSNPVRWDLCMAAMLDAGVTGIIEVAPAGTLVGLAKRSMPGVETLAVKTPDQIPAALELAAKHA
jgi:[acyl-carrier-protein] S-malonyltransferase